MTDVGPYPALQLEAVMSQNQFDNSTIILPNRNRICSGLVMSEYSRIIKIDLASHSDSWPTLNKGRKTIL